MLQSSSRYNQRLTQSKESRKVNNNNKYKSLEKNNYFPTWFLSGFNSTSRSESFYREVSEVKNQGKVIKLGWRVIELELDQIDLSVYCLSMLQAKLTLPAKFYTKSREEEGRTGN